MKPTQLIAAVLPLAVAWPVHHRRAPQALYYLDNNPAGASVVALQIAANGTLSDPVRTYTGGVGQLSNTSTGAAPAADNLFSQDAVIVSGSKLFTVSPGSDLLHFFHIPASDPTRLLQVGEPAWTGGNTPNSVAYSAEAQLACTLNTGAMSGVSCFHVDHNAGLSPAGSFLPITAIQQSTPPVGPPSTTSDLLFNPSGDVLYATVKGNGTSPGTIYAWRVQPDPRLGVWPTPVISRPDELLLNFGMDFLGEDYRAAIADPSYGASLVQIDPLSLAVTVTDKVTIANQTAICWSRFSSRFDAVFIPDAGNPNITALDPTTGAIKHVMPGPAGNAGHLDATQAGEFLYALQTSAGVSVFSLRGSDGNGSEPGLVQNANLTALGSRQGWQGMAVY